VGGWGGGGGGKVRLHSSRHVGGASITLDCHSFPWLVRPNSFTHFPLPTRPHTTKRD
jgi:hypothetical protein